jgi:hypothetical protein
MGPLGLPPGHAGISPPSGGYSAWLASLTPARAHVVSHGCGCPWSFGGYPVAIAHLGSGAVLGSAQRHDCTLPARRGPRRRDHGGCAWLAKLERCAAASRRRPRWAGYKIARWACYSQVVGIILRQTPPPKPTVNAGRAVVRRAVVICLSLRVKCYRRFLPILDLSTAVDGKI